MYEENNSNHIFKVKDINIILTLFFFAEINHPSKYFDIVLSEFYDLKVPPFIDRDEIFFIVSACDVVYRESFWNIGLN